MSRALLEKSINESGRASFHVSIPTVAMWDPCKTIHADRNPQYKMHMGGVGWGGVITFMLTCTPTSCYARVIFSCVCTHTSCYAMVGWGGVKTFMLTCTPTSCYARVIFSCACTHTHNMLRYGGVGWGGLDIYIYIYILRYPFMQEVETLMLLYMTTSLLQSLSLL